MVMHDYVVDLGGGISTCDLFTVDVFGHDLSPKETNRLKLKYPGPIICIDFDPNLGERAPKLNVVCRDIDKHGFPFCNDSCSFVRARDFLEHCRNLQFVMNEVWRVLQPGGLFQIKGPSAKSEAAWGNPDHVRVINTYTLKHFCQYIPNAGIQTEFIPELLEDDGQWLYAELRVPNPKPILSSRMSPCGGSMT